MSVNLIKTTAEQADDGRARNPLEYGELCTIAGFRLAVDTLAYGKRSGALGLYDGPEEYLREVLGEMEQAHAAQGE